MTTFSQRFQQIIDLHFEGKAARFCEKAGTKSAYLSEIINKGKLPSIKTLAKWLKKTGLDQQEADHLLFLCSQQKARQSDDMAPLLARFADREESLRSALRALAAQVRKLGGQPPDDLLSLL